MCWRRFSLRALFAFTAIFAVVLAWVRSEMSHITRLAQLEDRALSVGLYINYEECEAPLVQLGKCVFGERFHAVPVDLEFLGLRDVKENDLEFLRQLPTLKSVSLFFNPPISGKWLMYLDVCSNLSRLELLGVDASDSDVRVLAKCKHLEFLGLNDAKLSDNGLRELVGLRGLRWLSLENTRITDVSIDVLLRFPDLELANIDGTAITENGRARLRAANPRLRLSYNEVVTEEDYGSPVRASGSKRLSH